MARCPHGFERSVVPCAECESFPKAEARARSTRKPGQGEQNTAPGTYVCSLCGQEKPLSEFYLSRTSKLGHQSRCKTCDNGDRRSRLVLDPEQKKDETARWKARALAAEARVRVTRQWVANLVTRLDEVIGELAEEETGG